MFDKNLKNRISSLEEKIGKLESSLVPQIKAGIADINQAIENSLAIANKNHQEYERLSQETENKSVIIENNTKKSLLDIQQKSEDTIKHNFIVTEEICKNTSIALHKLTVEVEAMSKRIKEFDSNIKTYIDAHINGLKSDVEKVNARIADQVQLINFRIDAYSKDIVTLKDKVNELISYKVQSESKLENINRDIPGLREALKKNSSELSNISGIEKPIYSKMELMEKSFELQINNAVESKINEYRGWINSEYYNIVSRMLSVIAPLLSANASAKEKEELKKLNEELSQKSLQDKWEKERQAKGQQIINKGVKILEMRQAIHFAIIAKEKSGQYVGDLKEQLKAYDNMLEVIK